MKNKKGGINPDHDRFADELIEDILSTSDEEIIAEAKEDYEDFNDVVNGLRGIIKQAIIEDGKCKLEEARIEYRNAGQTSKLKFANISNIKKRAIIEGISRKNNQKKLTLAAREGNELSGRDLDSILEALYDLDMIDENGNPI